VPAERLDAPLVTLTRMASYSRLWLAIAAGLALTGDPRARRAALRGLAATAAASAIVNGPAKLLTRRRRPSNPSRRVLVRMPRSSSFPSGHSASAFAFATAASIELPPLAPALLPLAAAVAYSRIHTGVHYATDVAAGAAVGALCGVAASRPPWPPEDRAVPR
jgi:undecaprenyl-diphosphatase